MGIVHTVHGPPFMPLDGSMIHRFKTALIHRAFVGAERHAAARCHLIVSVADAMTKLFLSRGIGRREQYVTVYSGMETGRFLEAAAGEDRESMRRSLGFSDSDIVVGTVARLAEHKGHDDLLDALGAELKARQNLKLLWVGDGWWRQRLIERALGMGLVVAELDGGARGLVRSTLPPPNPLFQGGGAEERRSQVILTGLVAPERVAGFIRAMDILAHPSYREGLPRTVPQSLLCGVAPVAYDVDGTGEACIEGKTGRLVPVGDRAALRSAVMGLADSPDERRRLAEAGRELCRVRFSAETMVTELTKVYERALGLAGSAG
jgi:glycosyltransferase involved in cell wall biosynthesis